MSSVIGADLWCCLLSALILGKLGNVWNFYSPLKILGKNSNNLHNLADAMLHILLRLVHHLHNANIYMFHKYFSKKIRVDHKLKLAHKGFQLVTNSLELLF